jgi:hypothetical protein
MDDQPAMPVPELEAALGRLLAEPSQDSDELEALLAMIDAPSPFELTTGEPDGRAGELIAVRSAGAVEDRQVLVRGGWVDVALDVQSADSGLVKVGGTVLGVDEACSIQLLGDGVEVGLTVTDEFGEFTLAAIVPGRYELIVAGQGAEMSAIVDLS